MTWPTLDDLDALGTQVRRTVPAEFEDFNGHVNVRRHYQLHMDAAEIAFTDDFGIGVEWIERTGQSSFTVAQHVLFHAEILVGHEVSLHTRMLGVSSKVLHLMSVLANRTTGEIANTLEYVEAYVDLGTRRTTAMPDELARRVGALAARHAVLPWALPLSGTLGTSRRPAQDSA